MYFMPAVLKHATDEKLHVLHSHTDPVPLMIRFRCGFVPVGIFCAMIASLVAQKMWHLQKPPDHTLHKNKVTLRISGAIDVTLISKPMWYEVHIARMPSSQRALEEICLHVLETVCKTLDRVISNMCKQDTSSSSYELGFECPDHPDKDHMVINRHCPIRGKRSQSAKSLWLGYLKEESVMICPLEGENAIDLRSTKFSPSNLSPSFADRSLVWFGEVSQS